MAMLVVAGDMQLQCSKYVLRILQPVSGET